MLTRYVLPITALAGVIFAVIFVGAGTKTVPTSQPVAPPAQSPFASSIAGAGLVESSTENIAVGTVVPGVVTEVHVRVGDEVPAGTALFRLDDRDLQSQLHVRQAAVEAARQRLQKLENLPRPEDIPPAEARVRQAEASLADAKELYRMWLEIPDKSAVSAEELSSRKYAVEVAQAKLSQATADLALLRAGAWEPDMKIARAELAAAEAEVQFVHTELERRIVRAPVDAQVLQVKVRPGEYAVAGHLSEPLMLLGRTDPLHVRVDVDENDAWRLKPDSPARGFVRGNRELATALKFVRIEPFVVPKRSLTGESTERVDTRVLQVIYSFDPAALPVYVGQQMDVYIDGAK